MATGQTYSSTARNTHPPAVKSCDLCGQTRFDLVSERDRRGDVLHTAMCLNCGLVCHLEIPSESQLAAFYTGEYRQSYHGETTPSPRRVMRAWKNGQRILAQLQPHVPPPAKVFEVGAGIGCTVKAFELAGYEASGIDPGEGFQRYSQDRLRTSLRVGDLFQVPQEPTYDLVLLVHVIEHFSSPRRALSHIRKLIRPGGRLYVECPNLTAPLAPFSKMFHFAHIHNFNASTLKMLGEQTGFAVERVFSSENDPNLQVLFRCNSETVTTIERANVVKTWAALQQAKSWVRYHARGVYAGRRLAKVAGYLGEHLRAKRVVRDLERRCQMSPQGSAADASALAPPSRPGVPAPSDHFRKRS